jgi:hypothetical protein
LAKQTDTRFSHDDLVVLLVLNFVRRKQDDDFLLTRDNGSASSKFTKLRRLMGTVAREPIMAVSRSRRPLSYPDFAEPSSPSAQVKAASIRLVFASLTA